MLDKVLTIRHLLYGVAVYLVYNLYLDHLKVQQVFNFLSQMSHQQY